MASKQEITSAPTVMLEDIPADHQDIVGLYEEAFSMPTRTPDDIDRRNMQLEAADSLASETVESMVVKQLRHMAFIRVEDAKRRQDARTNSAATVEPISLQSQSEAARNPARVPDIRAEQMIRAMARLGYGLVKGGKGSHYKIFNPETGKTTTIPKHLGPRVIEAILKQTGITKERLISAL